LRLSETIKNNGEEKGFPGRQGWESRASEQLLTPIWNTVFGFSFVWGNLIEAVRKFQGNILA
jgi:hypothetical protein